MKDYKIMITKDQEMSPSMLLEELDKLTDKPINRLSIKINYSIAGYAVSLFEDCHHVILAKWLNKRKEKLHILNLDGNALDDRAMVNIINALVSNPDLELNTLSVYRHNAKLETLKYILDLAYTNEIYFKIQGLHCLFEKVKNVYNALDLIEVQDILTQIHVLNQQKQSTMSDAVVNGVTRLSQRLENVLNHKVPSYLAKGVYCLK